MSDDSYHVQIAAMLDMLTRKPMTRAELQMFTGLSQITVDKWVRAFRERKLIYIADYDFDSMGRLRIHKYLFNPGMSDLPIKIAKQRLKEREKNDKSPVP